MNVLDIRRADMMRHDLTSYQVILEDQGRINSLLAKINDQTLNYPKETLKRECQAVIDTEQNPVSLAQAFYCMGEIYKSDYNYKDNIYQAIKNFSHSLESANLKEVNEKIFEIMIIGFEDKVLDKMGILKKFTGIKQDEIEGLEELKKLGIEEVNSRINYRLSLIYRNGRSSAEEEAKDFDLNLAVKYLNEARKQSKVKQENTVDIALTINDHYAKYVATVMASSLLNADLSTYYNFYIIGDIESPVSKESEQKFSLLKQIADCKITVINVQKDFKFLEVLETILKRTSSFPKIAGYRLYLDKILPNNIKRVLYLDADTLVLEDLSYFNSIDLKNYTYALVQDMAFSWMINKTETTRDIFYNNKQVYINSGVVLFNLDKIRHQNTLSKLEKILENNPDVLLHYHDQDVLNILDDVYYISAK